MSSKICYWVRMEYVDFKRNYVSLCKYVLPQQQVQCFISFYILFHVCFYFKLYLFLVFYLCKGNKFHIFSFKNIRSDNFSLNPTLPPLNFLLDLLNYLKGSYREKCFILQLTPKTVVMVRAKPGQSKEHGTPSGSPSQVPEA